MRRRLSHDWCPLPLPRGVTFGEGTWCYSSYAFIHFRSMLARAVRIGRRTGIYHGSFFDLGPDGEVEIGDYCTLVGVVICTNARLRIGDYSFLAHDVVLADSFAAQPWPSTGATHSVALSDSGRQASRGGEPPISIGSNVWIGARAVLLSGARIGDGAIIGAAAVVDFDVPPFAVVAGNPGRIVGWHPPGASGVAPEGSAGGGLSKPPAVSRDARSLT